MRSLSRSQMLYAAASVVVTWILALTYRDALVEAVRSRVHPSHPPTSPKFGDVLIKDKVATITDTLYTQNLVPLILHYRAVLGPSWPIVFFTSQTTYDEHFSPDAPSTSAVWQRAVAEGSIETRIIPPEFNLTSRRGVNEYLANTWLWEQLAPAKHVLVFQADAIICANAPKVVDDFLQWDFIGAPLNDTREIYNGGLSLRNRNMILDILRERSWWEDWNREGTEFYHHGEDVWFSILMRERGGNMPSIEEALDFSREYPWQMKLPKRPMGYHKVHKNSGNSLPDIRKWCPDIQLAAPGKI